MPNFRYARTIQPLPPANSLPFPGNLIRGCEDCYLRKLCTAPVPGENIAPREVFIVGQNPGRWEDLEGHPFCGQSGQFLDSLLFQAGIPRSDVAISNRIHCRTPGNRELQSAELKACAKWLDMELSVVQPRIVVAMGKPAIDYFLPGNGSTVEHLHGKPVERDGRIILPCYHPAAALRDTSLIRHCNEDFQVLRGLIRGRGVSEYVIQDEFPNPDYRVADTPERFKQMEDEIRSAGEYAVDTEWCRGKLWSYQISTHPGSAWFVPVAVDHTSKIDLTKYDSLAVLHNYLADINHVDVDKFTDTMVCAYLTNEPQGLKALAYRRCGIKMVTYREVVGTAQHKLSLSYLQKAGGKTWPDPVGTQETKWDAKVGNLATRTRKPWSISRKIAKILKDFETDPDTNLWERWNGIPSEERAVVDKVMGEMPESSLMDIPFEQAVQYASRDADATIRVYHSLRKTVVELGLDFVLQMDLGILPMVYNMMQNGMAVDVPYLKKLSADYDIRLRVKNAELAGAVGHPFNPNSPDQVAMVVYKELGFKATEYTDNGKVSTDDQELKKTGSTVAEGIIHYRGLMKLKTTYADNLIRSAHPDAEGVPRVHTVLTTTRVATGRLSSKKDDNGEGANLQNIPTRNKEAKMIKNGFIAPEGKVLIEGDYSQIEMVWLAHLSNCRRLVELFLRGGDPHTEMAATIFGVSLEEAAKSKYRYPVKRLNFGVAYLIGAQGLSNQIQEYIADLRMDGEPVDIEPWDVPTCEKFLADWYVLNPEVKDFQLEMVALARRKGYVTDAFGRLRYIPEVTCPVRSVQEAGARQAANLPVTASAQGTIKLAMGRLWRELPGTEWADDVSWDMQIHDSLLVEATDDEDVYKPYLRWMRDIMCGVVSLRVPVKVDFKAGKKWGELAKVRLD